MGGRKEDRTGEAGGLQQQTGLQRARLWAPQHCVVGLGPRACLHCQTSLSALHAGTGKAPETTPGSESCLFRGP